MTIDIKNIDQKKLLTWILTLGVPTIILCIPTNNLFTSPIRLFLAITLMAIFMFAFENIHLTISSTLLPVFYIVLGLAPAEIAFKPWTSNLPWLVLGGILIANALTECGLIKRIVFKCMSKMGGSYSGIIWGMALCGVALTLFVPSKAIYPLGAFAFGICTALNLNKSKASAGIMMAAAFASLLPTKFMYDPYMIVLAGFGMEATGPIKGLNWFDFITNQWVSILFLIFMMAYIAKFFKPDTPLKGKDYFLAEYKQLGSITRKEKKALVISFLLLALLMTSGKTNLDAGWIFIFCGMLPFFPGVNVADPENLRKTNYGFIIFVASCSAIGAVAGYLGIGKLVADLCLPLLEGQSITVVLICIYIICVLLNFLLTPMAVMAAFALPFAQIALNLGINPTALYFVMGHALDQLLFPYEYGQYLFIFSFGLISMKHFVQAMGVKMIANFIFVFTILITYWKIIDFLML